MFILNLLSINQDIALLNSQIKTPQEVNIFKNYHLNLRY